MSDPILYFDRNIGRTLPDALKSFRLPVEHQCDHFAHNTPDDTWLAEIGRRGWVVFTHDQKFHITPVEMSAIKQFSVGCFYLWGNQAKNWEKMQCFAKAYDRVIAAIAATPKPFIFKIMKGGQLRQIAIP